MFSNLSRDLVWALAAGIHPSWIVALLGAAQNAHCGKIAACIISLQSNWIVWYKVYAFIGIFLRASSFYLFV